MHRYLRIFHSLDSLENFITKMTLHRFMREFLSMIEEALCIGMGVFFTLCLFVAIATFLEVRDQEVGLDCFCNPISS